MRYGRAAILCGGRSERMGMDKTLLRDAAGKYLLETMVDTLSERFDEIAIIRRSHSPLPFAHPKMRLIVDLPGADGPLCGICTALTDTEGYVFVIACDMPQVNLALIDAMYQRLTEQPKPVCICHAQGYLQPLYAFYHTELFADMLPHIGKLSPIRYILDRPHLIMPEAAVRACPSGLSAFENLNDPSALGAYQLSALRRKEAGNLLE